jgi:hypothetical protein
MAMKHAARALVLCAFLSAVCASRAADPIEYVKVCDSFGAGFMYVPGTDTCQNATTGDTRVATENGVWRSRLPYPTGRWVKSGRLDCPGRMVNVGTFRSTDFTMNAWNRNQTAPIALPVTDKEYVAEVMMSGGFYDPRLPDVRSGTQGTLAFCVRSLDPSIPEVLPEPNPEDPPTKPRWGNGLLPIGCIPNNRLLNMPATYVINADASYPSVERGFANEEQTEFYGPFKFNSHVAVTTDFGQASGHLLTYTDESDEMQKPLAGTVTVSVCVAQSLVGPSR